MPFQPGVSGNPTGRPKGTSFLAALGRMLKDKGEDGVRNDDAIALTVIAKARAGDWEAIRWITEKMDGPTISDEYGTKSPGSNVEIGIAILAAEHAYAALAGQRVALGGRAGNDRLAYPGTDAIPGVPLSEAALDGSFQPAPRLEGAANGAVEHDRD